MHERPSIHPLVLTKKERKGILFFVILLLITQFSPALLDYFYPAPLPEFSSEAELNALLRLRNADSLQKFSKAETGSSKVNYEKAFRENGAKVPLFAFDPNTLSLAGWQSLGISEKTATGIRKYISHGGKFRQPDDLKKIWGLSAAKLDQLLPYVKIATEEKSTPSFTRYDENKAQQKSAQKAIDINLADSAQWETLPGFGAKLSARMVQFRQKLGGFHQIDQVAELYGLKDSVYQAVKGRLILTKIPLRQININLEQAVEMKNHPYLGYRLANAIVAYRESHGLFLSIEDIKKIQLIDEKLFNKISPYLTLEKK
jgi:competence ComEA-like helix-hairpin-helix protein